MKSSLLVSIALLAALLTGCSSLLAFTPERAAVQAVLNSPVANLQPDAASVRVLQTQPVGEAVLVLVSFSGLRSGARELCDFVYVLERGGLGWRSSGGGGGCLPEAQPPGPIGIGSGWNGDGDTGGGYSHAAGLVSQVDITAVEVTWDDGETQLVDVVNSSYLAAREGQHTPTHVQARDNQEETVHTWAPPEPGKTEPPPTP